MSKSEMSPEKLADLKKNANGILANCRQAILRTQPFIGNVGMKLEIVPVRDCRVPTACTNGSKVFFDISFLAELNNDERKFVLAHELWHCVMLHFARMEKMEDKEIANIATDLEVNQILKKEGFIAPKDLCWPDLYNVPADLPAEEYYDLLMKQQQNGKKSLSSNSSKSKNGNGSGSGHLSGQFDKHSEMSKTDEENFGKMEEIAKQMFSDKYGEKGFDPDFQPGYSKDVVEKMRENALSAAQQAERSSQYRGNMPAYVQKVIDALKKPEIKWQEVLAQFVTRSIGTLRSWNRPNRRFVSSGTYLPSSYGEKIRIAVGIDTSGSCIDELPKFLGELNSLVKSFGSYSLTLIQCDAAVQDVQTYDEYSPLEVEGTKFQSYGGGGTILKPVFDYIKTNDVEADAVVMFTDGYIDTIEPEDGPRMPVLWLITRDGTSSTIKFGEVIHMKQSAFMD